MSILIKGMTMPKEGLSVVVDLWNNGKAYVYGTENAEMYEAVELPDHGDLIDRDALKAKFGITDWICEKCQWYDKDELYCKGGIVSECLYLEKAEAVIPAERSEE